MTSIAVKNSIIVWDKAVLPCTVAEIYACASDAELRELAARTGGHYRQWQPGLTYDAYLASLGPPLFSIQI